MSEILTHDNGLPYVEQGGHRRVLACLKPQKKYAFLQYSDLRNVTPVSEWWECDFSNLSGKLYDQNGHGSCVGHGAATGFTVAWNFGGATAHVFSPCCIYGQINGGRDNGAVVGDALEALTQSGVCLESTVPENDIYERNFPSGWKDEAGKYKAGMAVNCPNWESIGSAVMQFGHCVFGVDIGRNFNPDSQGVIPRQSGGGGGHCMCAVGLKQINGVWYLKVQNSWGNWGFNGFCYMEQSYFDESDNWALVAAKDAPGEPNVPIGPS